LPPPPPPPLLLLLLLSVGDVMRLMQMKASRMAGGRASDSWERHAHR